MLVQGWTNLWSSGFDVVRTVNKHESKTRFSPLIDAAHARETILMAKGGKPWARLVPLEAPQARRQQGLLRERLRLPPPEELLELLLNAHALL